LFLLGFVIEALRYIPTQASCNTRQFGYKKIKIECPVRSNTGDRFGSEGVDQPGGQRSSGSLRRSSRAPSDARFTQKPAVDAARISWTGRASASSFAMLGRGLGGCRRTYSGGTRTPWAGPIVPAVRAIDRCRRRVGDDVEVIYAREQITLDLSTAFGYREVP
jgi:hypothetical protein